MQPWRDSFSTFPCLMAIMLELDVQTYVARVIFDRRAVDEPGHHLSRQSSGCFYERVA